MDDCVAAGNSFAKALSVGHVTLDERDTGGRGFAGVPHEAAHRQVAIAQLADDVATHEPRPPGDEDHAVGSFWKFCQ
jgi:hypothetical protein